jgi:Fe-S cluster biogenesis protein NfuA
LESEYKDKFVWEYLATGPEEWVVNITKLKPYESKGEELRGKVMAGLDKVRPHLQADGGDVELVEIDDEAMIVRVKLKGACGTCPSAAMTLKSGVEAQIKKSAPEIRSVESVQVPAEAKVIEKPKPKAKESCCDHDH